MLSASNLWANRFSGFDKKIRICRLYDKNNFFNCTPNAKVQPLKPENLKDCDHINCLLHAV